MSDFEEELGSNWPEKKPFKRKIQPAKLRKRLKKASDGATESKRKAERDVQIYQLSQSARQKLAYWIKCTIRRYYADHGVPISMKQLSNRWGMQVNFRFRMPLYDWLQKQDGYILVEWFDGDTPKCAIWHILDWKKLTDAEKVGPLGLGIRPKRMTPEKDTRFFADIDLEKE